MEQQHEVAIKKLHSKYQAREEEMEQEAASVKSDAVARVKRGLCNLCFNSVCCNSVYALPLLAFGCSNLQPTWQKSKLNSTRRKERQQV